MKIKKVYNCSAELAVDLIGGKWKLRILWALSSGTKRFSELKLLVEGITQKMLTSQLRELEENNIVSREIFAVIPPKVCYNLTETGLSILPHLKNLCAWSKIYAKKYDVDISSCLNGCKHEKTPK